MGQSKSDETAHGRFMRAVRTEMEKFEQKETEFRRSDRKERATKLAVLAEADGDILPH